MKKGIISALLLIVFISQACKKDKEADTPTPVTPEPVANIVISEPLPSSTIDFEDTVHVDVHITADFDMHGYDIYLINLTADDTVWTADDHDHGQTYDIHGEWINTVTEHSNMKLKVIAVEDHDGNTTESEVEFHCHPME